MKRSSAEIEPTNDSEVEESEAYTKYLPLLKYEDEEQFRRERDEFRDLARYPESPDYLRFVQRLELWRDTNRRLIELRKDVDSLNNMSPLTQCDIVGTLIKHLTLIDHKSRGTEVVAEGYLLSAMVIKRFLESALLNTPSDFLGLLCKFISQALDHARPVHLKFNLLMWHDLEELDPLIRFLTLMTTQARLKDHTAEGPLKLRIETHKIGQTALELLLNWLDHIWGFALKSPVYEQFKYDELEAVKKDMLALSQVWEPMTMP